MGSVQIITLFLLGVFYISYIVKMFLLKRRGISGNLLGKGNKPKNALLVEKILRLATLAGAVIQFGSAMLPGVMWPVPVIAPVQIAGATLLLSGNIFFIAAVLTMRDNWRAGFDEKQETELVTQGIYGISRNPAFVGFDLLYMGCAAMFPNIINIVSALLAVFLFHIQILGEEKYCAEAFGQSYLDYKDKTMRYIGKRPRKIVTKLKARAKRLKIDIPAVFIALKKKETPILAKILAAVTVAYALSPVDLIPDFIPVIGFLDDVIILPGLIAVIIRLIPQDVFMQCREEAENLWLGGRPKKWYYALPIIMIWVFLGFIIVKLFAQ